jgi:multicomponent Na+:H+ antiporter subunit G
MNGVINIIALIIIYSGCFVLFSAALGLYRFPDIFMRLHACSKVNTGGAITIVFGLILLNGINMISAKLGLVLLLILILTPIISHAIAKSTHIHHTDDFISVKIEKAKRRSFLTQLRRRTHD